MASIQHSQTNVLKSQSFNEKFSFYDPGCFSDYYSHMDRDFERSILNRKHYLSQGKDLSASDKDVIKSTFKRIFLMAIGYNFNLKKITMQLKEIGINMAKSDPRKNVMIISLANPYQEKLIFIMDYGVIALFDFDQDEEIKICEIFSKNCQYLLNSKSNSRGWNTFFYRKGETFSIYGINKLSLESSNLTEKLAVAYALAQHIILSHYEVDVSNTIEETKTIPIEMRDKGIINLSKKEISQKIGLIFMRRSAVNLNSDILGVPDIFWEGNYEVEPSYNQIRKFLEINKRIEILDKRMKILKELYDVMNNEVKTQGKFRLEWIVVYLIVIEIFVALFWKMLVKDILKLY